MVTPHGTRDVARIALWAIYGGSAISFVGAVVWSTWVVRAFRRDRVRERDGLCMKCGFDLRQSKERCPECGEPIRGRKFHSR